MNDDLDPVPTCFLPLSSFFTFPNPSSQLFSLWWIDGVCRKNGAKSLVAMNGVRLLAELALGWRNFFI
jgi:hypothetical protein